MTQKEKIYLTVSTFIVLIAFSIYMNSAKILNAVGPKPEGFVGVVSSFENDVRIRYGNSVSWLSVGKNEGIYAGSYLFSGDNSDAKLLFVDKTVMTLSKNSLVHLNFKSLEGKLTNDNGQGNLELIKGNVGMKLGRRSRLNQIKVEGSMLKLKKDSVIRVKAVESKKSFEISVVEGAVALQDEKNNKYEVAKGEVLGIADKEKPEKRKLTKAELYRLKKAAEKDHQEGKEQFNNYKEKRSFSTIISEVVDSIKETLFF